MLLVLFVKVFQPIVRNEHTTRPRVGTARTNNSLCCLEIPGSLGLMGGTKDELSVLFCFLLFLVGQVTPRSLYVVIAMLLATGTITLEGVLQHISPGFISLAAAEK